MGRDVPAIVRVQIGLGRAGHVPAGIETGLVAIGKSRAVSPFGDVRDVVVVEIAVEFIDDVVEAQMGVPCGSEKFQIRQEGVRGFDFSAKSPRVAGVLDKAAHSGRVHFNLHPIVLVREQGCIQAKAILQEKVLGANFKGIDVFLVILLVPRRGVGRVKAASFVAFGEAGVDHVLVSKRVFKGHLGGEVRPRIAAAVARGAGHVYQIGMGGRVVVVEAPAER